MKTKTQHKDDGHEFVATVSGTWSGGTLLVDRQKRGGLLIQVGVERDGREEFNFIKLPKRIADRLRAFLREGGAT